MKRKRSRDHQRTQPSSVASSEMIEMKSDNKVTAFQRQVYDACSQIPSGSFTTYALLAKAIHSHPRAVGQALKKNPFAPQVPCHRVLPSDLTLGGFSGQADFLSECCQRKLKLLQQEGLHFDSSTGHLLESDRQKVFCQFASFKGTNK